MNDGEKLLDDECKMSKCETNERQSTRFEISSFLLEPDLNCVSESKSLQFVKRKSLSFLVDVVTFTLFIVKSVYVY